MSRLRAALAPRRFLAALSHVGIALAAFALLGGCGGSQEEGAPSAERSAQQVGDYVRARQEALHGGTVPASAVLVGHWRGVVALGGADVEVSGVSNAAGLMLLQANVAEALPLLLRGLRGHGDRIVGELVQTRAALAVSVFTLDGVLEADRFDGALVPACQLSQRPPNDQPLVAVAACPAGGHVRLQRVASPAQPKLAPAAAVTTLPVAGLDRLHIDASGNVSGSGQGCDFSGGVAPSDSVDGVFELAGDISGEGCALGGAITGVMWRTSAGSVILALTDGEHSMSESLVLPMQ